jgi:hypothetical protein
VGVPSRLKQNLLIEGGVGVDAKGYCFGSSSFRLRGGFNRSGGKEVVVVVVVVTTVVCVAGAYENCPRVVKGRDVSISCFVRV